MYSHDITHLKKITKLESHAFIYVFFTSSFKKLQN